MTKAELEKILIKLRTTWWWGGSESSDNIIECLVENGVMELEDMKPEEKADSDVGW